MKTLAAVAALAASMLAAVPAFAGQLIVAGDATIASRTVTAASTGNAALAGNLAFAQNILGGGDRAAIYTYSIINTYPNAPLGEQLAGAYNGFAGITATTFPGAITVDVLTDADLLVVLGRSNAFTVDETSLVKAFLENGGNVLLAGESANIAMTANNHINTLLADIGSSIRLNQVTEGIGDQFATDGEILADPLTAGITSFGYGRTTTVSGGKTLFLNDSGNPFVAYETIGGAVPEPATWAMMIAGFGLVGGAMRKRDRKIVVMA